jgi:hypothetical protein
MKCRAGEHTEIVGIKYDLVKATELPRSQRAKPPKEPPRRKQKPTKVKN